MMRLFKLFLLLLFTLAPTYENAAWAYRSSSGGHDGSFGGHSGSYGGHGGSYGGHGGYGHGNGRGYWGGYYGGMYGGLYAADPWLYFPWTYSYVDPGAYAFDAYPGAIVSPGAPDVYVERSAPPPENPRQASDWYYCQNPAGYYPYVKSCSMGWQRVPSRPSD